MTVRTKAERRQRRLRARRQEAMPLFEAAGIADDLQPIPDVTAIEAWYRREQANVYARVLRMRRDSLRDWARWKAMAAEYITPDQIAHMEAESRRIYPLDPLYRANYWLRFLASVGLVARIRQVNSAYQNWKHCYWPGAYLNLASGEWEQINGKVTKTHGALQQWPLSLSTTAR